VPVLLPFLVLFACSPDGGPKGDPEGADDTGDTGDAVADADRDGYSAAEGDCNEENAAINPLATDVVGDDIDQNCDGVDGLDADGDSHASVASGGDDCDDADGAVQLGGPWFADEDDDGYGSDDTTATGCEVPEGYQPIAGDCDDLDADTYPGAEECTADGRDNDCDPTTPDVQGDHPPTPVSASCEDGGMMTFDDGEFPTVELSTAWADEDGDLSTVELFWAYDVVVDGEVGTTTGSTGLLQFGAGTCEDGVTNMNLGLLLRVDGDNLPYDQQVEVAASLTDLQGNTSTWVLAICTTPAAP